VCRSSNSHETVLQSFEVVASESHPPNTDYIEYNAIKTALVAIPRDFNVRLKVRDGKWLEEKMTEENLKQS
jgi:phenylacetate 2-hydroxylase